MNNQISIIMLGLVLTACITFLVKGWRQPAQEKETQKGSLFGLIGAGTGFVVGMIFGATIPQLFFSDSFLRQEGAELGAIALLTMGFSVVGAICSLLIYSIIKRKA